MLSKLIAVKSLDDILRCINLASLLELSGWPKPGNVHRSKDYESTRFEHFLAGISAIQPNFRMFCERIYEELENNEADYGFIKLGQFFESSSNQMMQWQEGGNVLLGHLLILAPLAAAGIICFKQQLLTIANFNEILKKVINDTTVDDTVSLYNAIKICNPGGLGKIDKYDLNDDNSINEIKNDKITLKIIFELSKNYDMISREYSTKFSVILKEGLPYFFNTYETYKDINIATVNTFLKVLSNHPDTLIIRKSGLSNAKNVSEAANRVLKLGGVSTKNGLKSVMKLDKKLHFKNGLMNPGTTADILAGILFCALLFGLRF
ncbi:MAG: triphosphoribosyl-dephospho-CoA synthase [Promethearchaeota archaeon]